MVDRPLPRRGEVWSVRFDPSVGAEIRKLRPAVVLSVEGLGRLPLRIVVPITDWKSGYERWAWFVKLSRTATNGLSKESGADAFQVKSISDDRFIQRLGVLRDEQVDQIANAIALCIGV